MLISPAFAQAAGAGQAEMLMGNIVPLVLIFGVFYFLLIRPQQKRAKQHKEMLNALRRGDRVVIGGGIFGTVVKLVNDGEVAVEIAEGVRVRVVRSSITEVISKTEPVAAGKEADDDKADKDK
jgi:preprotein translocase subunit YajC